MTKILELFFNTDKNNSLPKACMLFTTLSSWEDETPEFWFINHGTYIYNLNI